MPEEITICPLCGNDRSEVFDQREQLGRPVTNRCCTACGLVFQSPRMTEAEASQHYMAEYRKTVQGREGPTPKDLDRQMRRAALLIHFLRTKVKRVRHHLDIGCSSGILLQNTTRLYQAKGLGVEPGEAYRQYARENGVETLATLDDVERTCQEPFDLISLIHVLEHLNDPIGYLSRLREKLLAPDGRLLLEVPNVYIHDSFEFEHPFSFSRRTLTEVLRKAGFEPVAVRVHGRPISQMFPFYITMLARPCRKVPARRVHPDRWAALKRRLGFSYQSFVCVRLPRRWWNLIPTVSDAPTSKKPD